MDKDLIQVGSDSFNALPHPNYLNETDIGPWGNHTLLSALLAQPENLLYCRQCLFHPVPQSFDAGGGIGRKQAIPTHVKPTARSIQSRISKDQGNFNISC